MKRMVALLVCLVLILAVFPTSKVQADNIPLSQMSDEEILAFLDTYEIAIPDGFTESDSALAARIRKWITDVESNPNIEFMYSHTDLHNVAYAIKNAVNRYYGYTSSESKATRSLNYTLQYSTLYEVPANMTLFNCYSYAIGISSAWYNPGAFSGYTLTENDLATMFVDDIADLVIADFQSAARGQKCAYYTMVRPTSDELDADETAICVRIGDDGYGSYDYHFMRLFDDNGDKWRHKPSGTAILTYNGYPLEVMPWTNEHYYNGIAYAGDIIYDGSIRYIIFADSHDYGTPIYTGYNYHSGTKHYYQYSKTCSTCGLATTYYTSTSCLDCGGATVRP